MLSSVFTAVANNRLTLFFNDWTNKLKADSSKTLPVAPIQWSRSRSTWTAFRGPEFSEKGCSGCQVKELLWFTSPWSAPTSDLWQWWDSNPRPLRDWSLNPATWTARPHYQVRKDSVQSSATPSVLSSGSFGVQKGKPFPTVHVVLVCVKVHVSPKGQCA